jgi:hypothetical protein
MNNGGPVVTYHVAIGPLSYDTSILDSQFNAKGPPDQVMTMCQLAKISIISCVLLITSAVHAEDLSFGGTTMIGAAETGITAGTVQGIKIAQGNGKTLNEAVEQVRRQYNGRIVSAETKRSGNREVHHIKVLLDDGKVKTVQVQGRTLNSGG